MGFDVQQVFGKAGSTLQLVRVEGYQYVLGDDGGPLIDELGRLIPSGLLDVSTLDREGTREGVPFVLPGTGNSAFMGILPEIGATGVMGFQEQLKPIIIGFLPPSLDGIIAGRGTIPALLPGEALMQASTADLTTEGRSEIFVGARVFLDTYGRVVITAQDYKLTVGYILSGEYGPDVQMVLDNVTGQPIYLEENLPAGTGRRVDNDGSTVWSYGKHKYERVGGNSDTKVNGTAVSEARDGHVFKDRKNNRFGTDADGNFEANLATGGFTVDTQAGQSFKSGGPVTRQTIKGLRETIGGNYDLRTGQIKTEFAGTEVKQVLGAQTVTVGGLMALVGLGLVNISSVGALTMLGSQIILGPAPLPLVNYPGLLALMNALILALQGGVTAAGPVSFPALAAVSGLIAAAQTTVVKGT